MAYIYSLDRASIIELLRVDKFVVAGQSYIMLKLKVGLERILKQLFVLIVILDTE